MHMCILHFVALTLESQLLIIDKVKLEPYFNRKPCAEKPVLDGAFVDNLPHKIATTFLLISLKKGLTFMFPYFCYKESLLHRRIRKIKNKLRKTDLFHPKNIL